MGKPKVEGATETVSLPPDGNGSLRTTTVQFRATAVERLELSPDGRFLIVTTKLPLSTDVNTEPRLIQSYLIDLTAGKFVETVKSEWRVRQFGNHMPRGVQERTRAFFSPDGRQLHVAGSTYLTNLFGEYEHVRLADYEDKPPHFGSSVSWSPNGQFLWTYGSDSKGVSYLGIWDAKEGKQLSRFEDSLSSPLGIRCVFSHDGGYLVTEHYRKYSRDTEHAGQCCFQLWDTRTGQHLARFGEGIDSAEVAGFVDGFRVRLSPLGKTALFPPYQPAPRGQIPLLIPSDAADQLFVVKRLEKTQITVGEERTGQTFLRVRSPAPEEKEWSLDERKLLLQAPRRYLLARASGSAKHHGWAHTFPFVLKLWDVTEILAQQQSPSPKPIETPKLSSEQLLEAWSNLAEADVSKAHAAMKSLLDAREQLGPFLEERLRPAPLCTAEQVGRWITDLDSDEFAIREAAERALLAVTEKTAAALERKLKEPDCPLEVRRRGERILEQAKGSSLVAGEVGRMLWVIELLERWNTDEAKRLLRKLASGAPDVWITLEAQDSLKRLSKASK
jgi:hypothetical protein